jgi:hypothetical protein
MRIPVKHWKNLLVGLFCLLMFAGCGYSQEELNRRGFVFGLNEEPLNRQKADIYLGGKTFTELHIELRNNASSDGNKPEFFINDEKLKRNAREAGIEKIIVKSFDGRESTIDLTERNE